MFTLCLVVQLSMIYSRGPNAESWLVTLPSLPSPSPLLLPWTLCDSHLEGQIIISVPKIVKLLMFSKWLVTNFLEDVVTQKIILPYGRLTTP